ncbi:MAG: phosphodiester glycosidase family protein [Verrucomicrobiales bacterium]|nr:phosphodiester glycosidase family protein [Verrucomicrobiales bacterium]
MNTDTAETDSQSFLQCLAKRTFAALTAGILALLPDLRVAADPVLGQWIPLYQGMDRISGTNTTRGTDFQNLMAAYAIRVDLQAPGIRLLASPRIDNYQSNSRETAGMTVSRFVKVQGVQAAINAGFFRPTEYYLPEGTPMSVQGLLISQGEPVSPAGITYAASLYVDAGNHARIYPYNWPAADTNGIWTAVSGDYPVLVDGANIGRKYLSLGFIHDVNPRTAVGLSQDRRFLYLLVIDGRQPGYSEGAYDYETAAWLQLLGAWDGINLDGGGSSTMSIQGVNGNPVRLNQSSAVADSGRERTVGGHLGIFANPLEGFVNTVVALPDDDAASITWKTLQPATTQVEYGTTPDLGLTSDGDATPVTQHAVRLTGLQPGTGYYFRAVSFVDGVREASSDLFFTTKTYLVTNEVVTLTQSWKFTEQSMDGLPWMERGFNDSAWSGPGPALLWVDTRPSGPNPDIQPKGTEMPFDPATGSPFFTYYFRTHFTLAEPPTNASLFFSGYVDDGAVFHLNGRELIRLRMDDPPLEILNSTLATNFPCAGDATCLEEFTVGPPASGALLAGDNVLAVEVHNYNPRSADITFGLSLVVGNAVSVPARLDIRGEGAATTLAWDRGGFVLQQAPSPNGPWTDVPGPVITSPHTLTASGTPQFYRLLK